MSKYCPAGEDFDVDAFPLYWVARVNARYGMAMEKKLRAVGMDVARWRVAVALHTHGELSISQVAEHAVAKLPTMAKIIYRMQGEGLVDVRPSASDGRVSLVSLTEKGANNIAEIRRSTKDVFNRLYVGLSEAQLDHLNATLRTMLKNLQGRKKIKGG